MATQNSRPSATKTLPLISDGGIHAADVAKRIAAKEAEVRDLQVQLAAVRLEREARKLSDLDIDEALDAFDQREGSLVKQIDRANEILQAHRDRLRKARYFEWSEARLKVKREVEEQCGPQAEKHWQKGVEHLEAAGREFGLVMGAQRRAKDHNGTSDESVGYVVPPAFRYSHHFFLSDILGALSGIGVPAPVPSHAPFAQSPAQVDAAAEIAAARVKRLQPGGDVGTHVHEVFRATSIEEPPADTDFNGRSIERTADEARAAIEDQSIVRQVHRMKYSGE